MVLAGSLLSSIVLNMSAQNLHKTNADGFYCHIYNQGIENAIFRDEQDYGTFLAYLKQYLSEPADPKNIKKVFTVNGRSFRGIPHQPKNYFNKIELIAYSLMPNDFHLVLHQKTHGSLESFIRSLCTRYSMYFNKRYHRSGSLFQGPYKSVLIKDNQSLINLTRSLHKNPQSYSSYPEYLGRRSNSWVNTKVVLSFFKVPYSYIDFVEKSVKQEKQKIISLQGLSFQVIFYYSALISFLVTAIIIGAIFTYNPRGQLIFAALAIPVAFYFIIEFAQQKRPVSNLEPLPRKAVFPAVTLIFLLLLGLGIRNVMSATTRNTSLESSSALISKTEDVMSATSQNPSPEPSPTPIISNQPLQSPTPTEETNPITLLIIKITDGSTSVNIRQAPTVRSAKIGEAKEADTFEFISVDSGWYEIKLADESTGFISARYIEVQGETNKEITF